MLAPFSCGLISQGTCFGLSHHQTTAGAIPSSILSYLSIVSRLTWLYLVSESLKFRLNCSEIQAICTILAGLAPGTLIPVIAAEATVAAAAGVAAAPVTMIIIQRHSCLTKATA